jgi:hypothetical protein
VFCYVLIIIYLREKVNGFFGKVREKFWNFRRRAEKKNLGRQKKEPAGITL